MIADPISQRRPPLWREVVVGLAVFGFYVYIAATATAQRRHTADRNAHWLLAFEQWAHIDIEKPLNDWLAVQHSVLSVPANYAYAYSYVLSAFAVLFWLYLRDPDGYRPARTSFIVLNLLGITCFALFPVTPPRLLPDLGYVDTVMHGGTFGSWGTPLLSSANQLAAMPSMHLAWALWVSVVLARLGFSVALQVLNAVHIVVTVFVIVATANHFLVDAIAAIPFVWVSVGVVNWRRSRARPSPVRSADAFFLHVETDAAPQHVGGMVVLAPCGGQQRSDPGKPPGAGAPTLDEIRALVRQELQGMPRLRQRLCPPSRWRRWRWIDLDASELDWDWHVSERVAALPRAAEGLEAASAALCEVVAELAATPLPRDRPMWRIVVVREIAPGRTGLIFLVHHSVADGIGTVVHALNLLRPRLDLPVGDRQHYGRIRTAAAIAVGLVQLATDGRPAAKLPGGSSCRQFAAAAFDLDTVRAVARNRGVRVTDLILTLLASAVATRQPAFADAVGQRLHVLVPIMMREPGSAAQGNVTAGVFVDVPLGHMNIEARLADTYRRSASLRTPARALAARFVMTRVLAVLPSRLQRWFARSVYGPRYLQAIVTNMAGPAAQLSIAGVPIERVFPILPLAPGAPLALGALSWCGVLGIGLAVDAQVLDAQALTTGMADALRELAEADATLRVERIAQPDVGGGAAL